MKFLTIATILLIAQSATAATLQFDASGNLIGATGVVVNGITYDIELRDTSCAIEYDGCDAVELTDFPFGANPNPGTLAIVDQVLGGLTSDQITGCFRTEHPRLSFCDLVTPASQSGLVIGSPARVNYLGDAVFPGNFRLGANFDFAQDSTRVLVVWTRNPPLPARCNDGNDNDGDSLVDFPNDPGCADQNDDNEADATLIFDGAGRVFGATGVEVLGNIYSVEFQDGTCAALFDGCDAAEDFMFPGEALSNAAALALAQHVLPGLAPKSIRGCGPEPVGACAVYTPANPMVSASTALLVSPDDARSIGQSFFGPNDDFSANSSATFAIWTQLPDCSDGLDNDGDGRTDFPNDPGCTNPGDNDETDPPRLFECNDEFDNDFDGLVDFPEDPGCDFAEDDDESNPPDLPVTQCNDGIDNDDDGFIDFPMDPECRSGNDENEADGVQGPTLIFEFTGICTFCGQFGVPDFSPIFGVLVVDESAVVPSVPLFIRAKDIVSINIDFGTYSVDFPATANTLFAFGATVNDSGSRLEQVAFWADDSPDRGYRYPDIINTIDTWRIVDCQLDCKGPVNVLKVAGGNEGEWRLVGRNEAPTADAGIDQAVRVGDTVFLDGSSSFDDNTPTASLQYDWSLLALPDGSSALLMDPGTATPNFAVDTAGTYVIQLVVTDEMGLAGLPDAVTISSDNMAPTADAGMNQLAIVGSTVFLDGTGSTDPENDPLSFAWTIASAPQSSTAELDGADTATPNLQLDLEGLYEVTLVVSDLIGPGTPDSVEIMATTPEQFAEIEIVAANEILLRLRPTQVTTQGNQQALMNFLLQATVAIQEGDSSEAINKLQKALSRTDGCDLRGAPDGNGPGRDWVTDCSAQSQIYSSLQSALKALSE